MNPWAILGGVVAAILIGGAGFYSGNEYGSNGVQAKWNVDKAARATAEKAAVLARVAENHGIFRQQEITSQNITKAHDDELAKVRADLAHAPRLRIGTALCSGPASTAQAPSTSSGNAADSASRLVREDVGRDIDALKLKIEEAFATGRACQAFVTSNGLAP